jgi:hypothetical protein
MTIRTLSRAGAALVLAALPFAAPGPAGAQESTNRVAVHTDWSVYVDDNPKECWLISAPRESVNTRDGKPVAVRRGDIRLYVTYRPGTKAGEISFAGGYPFAEGSNVGLDVSGTAFDLFTQGETAWATSSDQDAKIIAAMKAGSAATLTARSARGTQTKDTFSLNGISAALDEAAKRCAG